MKVSITVNFEYEIKNPRSDSESSIQDHIETFIQDEYGADADVVIEELDEEEEGE